MVLDKIPGTQLFVQRDVRETPTVALTDAQKVPIGAILPWLKSFSGTPTLPTGFVECNGQTLSDADSVYNGATIPNLNGSNYFLRGNSTSGGTGGSTTTGTNVTYNSSSLTLGGLDSIDYADGTPGHVHSGNEPPYYNVVWIMRVK